jgi:ABC-2 type transport system ATP-binding protein
MSEAAPSSAPAVIRAVDVRKSYGDLEAVAGVDLVVHRGEVFAMLGPNGAGKTTTVEILEGYRLRNRGEVEVLGQDPAKAGASWRARMGIVPQGTGAFELLTVAELVHHFAHFYEHPLDADETIDLVGLTEKRDSRLRTLSGGQQRRVDLALGIVGDPELVFLDEPTTGLDPQARRQVWALVERMTRLGKTVLLTTHYLDEAEALADRVAVIVSGRIVAEGTPRDIGGRSDAVAVITFERRDGLSDVPLPDLPVDRVDFDQDRGLVRIETEEPTKIIERLAGWARSAGSAELPGLTIARPTLEDTYLRLIAAERRERSVTE